MYRVLLVVLFALFSFQTLAAPATPAEPAKPAKPAEPAMHPAQAGDRPCRNDMAKFCGAHMNDQGAMRTCMRENHSKFSAQCQAAMKARQEHGHGQAHQGNPERQGGPPAKEE